MATMLKQFKKILSWPFHPVVLALYPVLFLYSSNSDQTPVRTLIGPLSLSLLAAPVLWVGPYFLFKRDLLRSSIWVSLLVFLFFVYGHVHTALQIFLIDISVNSGEAAQAELLMKKNLHIGISVVWLGLLVLVWHKLRNVRAVSVEKLSGILNTVSAVLLLMPVLGIIMGLFAGSDTDGGGREKIQPKVAESGLIQTLGYLPDIYHIVLDGYAREDVLMEFYGHDNSPFLGSLKAKGFMVPAQARSNYGQTFLSFASFLNMDYINANVKHLGPYGRNRSKAYLMARDNEVMHFLHNYGYRYIHLNSTWGATMMNTFADEEIPCTDTVFNVEFYRVLMESTFLKVWESPVGVSLADCHLNNLETLENIGSERGPKLVMSHFLPPHHPYLFDRDGNVLSNATVSNQFDFQKRLWGVKSKYIDQLVYFNKRMEIIVEKILAASDNPPIIMIHSDHGPKFLDDDKSEYLHGRFSILLALHLPGVKPEQIPDNLSLVNLYRQILNHYFDSGFELLEKRYYHSTHRFPYNFREVKFDFWSPRGRKTWRKKAAR